MPKTIIGALWSKTNQYGEYYTGNVEIDGKKTALFIGRTKEKKTDRHPDWLIYLSESKDQQKTDTPQSVPPPPIDTINLDDIPF